MAKKAWVFPTLLAICLVAALICIVTSSNKLNVYIDVEGFADTENISVLYDDDIVEIHDMKTVGKDMIRLTLSGKNPGQTRVRIYDDGLMEKSTFVRVGGLLRIYETVTGNYPGYYGVCICVTVFFTALFLLLLGFYLKVRGSGLYSYQIVACLGLMMFSLLVSITCIVQCCGYIMKIPENSARMMYDNITNSGLKFVRYTSPLLIVFSALMCYSNIVLMSHEGHSQRNKLGIFISLIMLGGAAFVWVLPAIFGMTKTVEIILSAFSAVYVYYECMLAGTIICAWRAAVNDPDADTEFVVILGCKFRKDGTLYPQIRGRVDRAVEFAKEALEKTGKRPVLVPSGGQGSDEPMQEAVAMKNYLIRDVNWPEDHILIEDRSKNTRENMIYSKELIDTVKPGAKTVFATTNYHVFRSGIIAHQTGWDIDGMGAHIIWYYWPNAFVREYIGMVTYTLKFNCTVQVILAVGMALMKWLG